MITSKITISLFFLCCFFFGQINRISASSGNSTEQKQVSIAIDKNSPLQVFGISKIENYGEGNSGLWADGKTSPQIEQYTRESVTQVINEYPDLTGLGITLGEAMQKWDGEQMTDWVDKTIFEGIRTADRKVKFIYRAALSGNHQPHRDLIDSSGIDTPENPIMVELKFNWSHAHSTTTLIKAHGGGTGSQYWENPAPTHHKMAWMMRNEDFFRLRWGEPDFIREHIKVNGQNYVGGYCIGSECLIPARDIFHKPNHPHVNWKYEFEKQWLYYQQWGRLLYDPTTSDAVFANSFDQRFSGNIGNQMVEAYKLSTRTTQRIAQSFNFTWVHSFYTEGFIGNKRTFIKLDELIEAKPIEPNFVSIKEFGDGSQNFGTKVTPLQLAATLEKDNQHALNIVNSISTSDETLKCEIEDVKAWAYLGLYFAKKIRTGVALNQNKKADALTSITEAQQYWSDLVKVTEEHIQPSHLAITEDYFHWKNFQDEVDAEVEWVKNSGKNEKVITVKPTEYNHALRNPLKGFTTRGIYDHPWATTAQTYIQWNELENSESDGIEKIKQFCDQKWAGVEDKNIKVIPRVYLHWSGNRKYWPADMQEDDYTSEQFQQRVLRLIERLGECWDNDPRVAFIEMGIFGKWGEHHSPSPTPEMQKLVGDTFAAAFKNKKVSVRHNWIEFQEHPFGEYWDSWAHYDQMWPHGNSIKQMNDKGRYLENYVGGEVAYDWGNSKVQLGPSPTASVAEEKHRNFAINSIRWLHCTQLRWIEKYDQNNEAAVKGAEEIQKAFGYRFVLDEVRFSFGNSLNVEFDVTNFGSAPFYYNWPVELALLDPETKLPVWKSTFDADIRKWLPGEGWTDPDWAAVTGWSEFLPDSNWTATGICKWENPPQKNTVKGNFKVDIPKGKTYILSLAILDPSGNLPTVRFATANYFNGGRHPVGMVDFNKKQCFPLQTAFPFDNPAADNSLYYKKGPY